MSSLWIKLTVVASLLVCGKIDSLADTGIGDPLEMTDPVFRDINWAMKPGVNGAASEFRAVAGHGINHKVDVDPFSGVVRVVDTDLVLPGAAGLDLVINRTYRSQPNYRWKGGLYYYDGFRNGEMGFNWSLHLGRLRAIVGTGVGTNGCAEDFPVFELPDGTTQQFYSQGNHTYISRDRWIMRDNCELAWDGATNGFCIWSPIGLRYDLFRADWTHFDTRVGSSLIEGFYVGQVSRIVDRFGNMIEAEYKSTNNVYNPRPLTGIHDSYGRKISFLYDECGHVTQMKVADAAWYYYDYDKSNPTCTYQKLIRATYPDGSGYQYEYGDAGEFDNGGYDLIRRITNPFGGIDEYDFKLVDFYVGGGNWIKTGAVGSRVSRDDDGSDAEVWEYDYSAPSSGMNITTTHRPDGLYDVYEMWGFGAVANGSIWMVGLTQTIERGLAQTGGPAAELEVYEYEKSEALASVRWAVAVGGCWTSTPFDSDVRASRLIGRTVRRDGGEYVTRYSGWDAYDQPTRIDEFGERSRSTAISYEYVPTDGNQPLNLVHGLVSHRQVCDLASGQCVDQGSTYNGPHHAKDSETVAGRTKRYSYYSDGLLASLTDAAGAVTKFSTYRNGVPTVVTDPLNHTTTFGVDWYGDVVTKTDAYYKTVSYQWDPLGRLSGLYPPGGAAAALAKSLGKYAVWWITSPEANPDDPPAGYWWTDDRDGFGRRRSGVNREGGRYLVLYDGLGRVQFKSYPYTDDAIGDLYSYDALGRIVMVQRGWSLALQRCGVPGACEVTYAYSGESGRHCVTLVVNRTADSNGRTTESSREKKCYTSYGDPDVKVIASEASLSSGGGVVEWRYAHDANGDLTEVYGPMPAARVTNSYDPVTHDLVLSVDGPTGVTAYPEYDAAGRLKRKVAAASETTYAYDAGGHTSSIFRTGSDGTVQETEFIYDDVGNLRVVDSSGAGIIVYGHDELDRVTYESWQYDRQKILYSNWHYDVFGCADQVRYPSGAVLFQECDSAGRVTRIDYESQTIVKDVKYTAASQWAGAVYGNGVSVERDFDERARVKRIAASAVGSINYVYDGADNVVRISDDLGQNVRSMQYDLNDRLTVAVAPDLWGAAVYDYDELGNRTLSSIGSSTTSFVYDTAGTGRLLYARGGNPPRDTLTLGWTPSGSLAWASGGQGVEYAYNEMGWRVRKSVVGSGSAILYYYDPDGKLLSESGADGKPLRDYVYCGGALVAVVERAEGNGLSDNVFRWYHTDLLGSVIALTDSAGAVVARADYGPWGELWQAYGDLGERRYSGRVYDSDTALQDCGTRLYDAYGGRFVSPDVLFGDLENPASFNRYGYVNNNPYKYVDPDGHTPLLVVTGLIGLVGGGIYGGVSSAMSREGFSVKSVLKWGAIGGVAGLTLGAGTAWAVTGSAVASASEVGAVGAALVGMGTAAGQAGSGPVVRLYHGGPLMDGIVKASEFSVTPDLEHAQLYAGRLGGKVYAFDVPLKWLAEMQRSGGARKIIDQLYGDAGYAEGVQFLGEAATKLNDWMVMEVP